MMTLPLLHPEIKKRLEGRAACWHDYMGGTLPPDQCRDAAVAFWGYPSVEALAADYPALPLRLDTHGRPGLADEVRWELLESEAPHGLLLLRNLVAYAETRGRWKYSMDFRKGRMGWMSEGRRCSQKISGKVKGALLRASGILVIPEADIHSALVTVEMLYGKVQVAYCLDVRRDDLSIQLLAPAPIEQAGGIPDRENEVRALLDPRVAAWRRLSRTPDFPEIATMGHARVRA